LSTGQLRSELERVLLSRDKQMNFNSIWHGPFTIHTGTADIPGAVQGWGCKGKAGIYVIRDEFDSRTLYVGKAENTSVDIRDRLISHLTDERQPGKAGNKGIGMLSRECEVMTVRWVESNNPALAESIAIIQLEPLFNQKSQWGIDRASLHKGLEEAKRLGLRPERADYLTPAQQKASKTIDRLMRQAELEASSPSNPTQAKLEDLKHNLPSAKPSKSSLNYPRPS
jgi:hypothetical protein